MRPTTRTPTVAPRATAGAFWVQVAATSTRQEAAHFVQVLKGKGYPARLETPSAAGAKDHLYRIRVGPFVSREQADQTRSRLATDGYKQAFIKH